MRSNPLKIIQNNSFSKLLLTIPVLNPKMFNVKETGLNFEVVNRKSWMIYCNNLLQELTKPVNPKLQIYHNVDIKFKLAAITVHRRGNNVFYITGKHWHLGSTPFLPTYSDLSRSKFFL